MPKPDIERLLEADILKLDSLADEAEFKAKHPPFGCQNPDIWAAVWESRRQEYRSERFAAFRNLERLRGQMDLVLMP